VVLGHNAWMATQYIYMFIYLMDSKKQKYEQREIQYVQYQQSIHTCIVYSISNEQFTVL